MRHKIKNSSGFILISAIILIHLILLILLPLLEQLRLQQKLQSMIDQQDQLQTQTTSTINYWQHHMDTNNIPVNCQMAWHGSDMEWQRRLQDKATKNYCSLIFKGIEINYLLITTQVNTPKSWLVYTYRANPLAPWQIS
jgi:hypothetical protein